MGQSRPVVSRAALVKSPADAQGDMRRKAEGTWYLIAKYRRHAEEYQRQADNAAKIGLFENYVAKHGAADIHITPNETDKLARIHASFRELPENPVEVREQLERAGFIDPCFIRCAASAV
jgi:hypothetical protein